MSCHGGELRDAPDHENGNGRHFTWVVYLAVFAFMACVGSGIYYSRQLADHMGLEAAIGVMNDPQESENTRRAACLRVHFLGRMSVEAMVHASKEGPPLVSRDATAYLGKIKAVLATAEGPK